MGTLDSHDLSSCRMHRLEHYFCFINRGEAIVQSISQVSHTSTTKVLGVLHDLFKKMNTASFKRLPLNFLFIAFYYGTRVNSSWRLIH